MVEIDVAIAGGGPAGLAVANAIRSVYSDNVVVKVMPLQNRSLEHR